MVVIQPQTSSVCSGHQLGYLKPSAFSKRDDARSFILNRGIVTDNSLGGVECTAHHPGSWGVTMPLLSIKDLAVAISTRVGPAEDDPLLCK